MVDSVNGSPRGNQQQPVKRIGSFDVTKADKALSTQQIKKNIKSCLLARDMYRNEAKTASTAASARQANHKASMERDVAIKWMKTLSEKTAGVIDMLRPKAKL